MIRMLFSLLLGTWQRAGLGIDPWGNPNRPTGDSGPGIDPWG